MSSVSTEHLKNLGSQKTEYMYDAPCAEMLEVFDNPVIGDIDSFVVHTFEEFTSLCPKTGQPDFATITVHLAGNKLLVETKSLKLYYFAYRNHKAFMEDTVNKICADIVQATKPKTCHVTGVFKPRGGIETRATASYCAPWEAPHLDEKMIASLPKQIHLSGANVVSLASEVKRIFPDGAPDSLYAATPMTKTEVVSREELAASLHAAQFQKAAELEAGTPIRAGSPDIWEQPNVTQEQIDAYTKAQEAKKS